MRATRPLRQEVTARNVTQPALGCRPPQGADGRALALVPVGSRGRETGNRDQRSRRTGSAATDMETRAHETPGGWKLFGSKR
jgi:hypothetical protein